jgi:hypothetical protein
MYEHERSLVTELKDKPFALVGFNYGDKLEHIQNAAKEKRLIWRSFYGGDDKETVEKYKIEGFPTIMIIDSEGVIKSVGHGPNDALIHELLADMQ